LWVKYGTLSAQIHFANVIPKTASNRMSLTLSASWGR
jgi:hypothetical protein